MPITVSHYPDPALLARAGYQAGMGEFMQRQQQLQQQERMQMRSIQANQMSQQFAAQQGMQRDAMRFEMDQQRDQFGADKQRAFQMRDQQFRKKMGDQAREDKFDMFRQEMKHKRMMQESAAENSQQGDVVKFLLGQAEEAATTIREMQSEGYEFEDGGAKWQATQRELDTLRKDPTLSPMARSQAIYEKMFQEDLVPQLKRPKMQAEVEENTAWVPDPNDPTGKSQVLVGRAREFSALHKPSNKDEPVPLSVQSVFSDPKLHQEYIEMARDFLTVEQPTKDGKTVKIPPKPAQIEEWIRDNVGRAMRAQYDDSAARSPVQQRQNSAREMGKPRRVKWTGPGKVEGVDPIDTWTPMGAMK